MRRTKRLISDLVGLTVDGTNEVSWVLAIGRRVSSVAEKEHESVDSPVWVEQASP